MRWYIYEHTNIQKAVHKTIKICTSYLKILGKSRKKTELLKTMNAEVLNIRIE